MLVTSTISIVVCNIQIRQNESDCDENMVKLRFNEYFTYIFEFGKHPRMSVI